MKTWENTENSVTDKKRPKIIIRKGGKKNGGSEDFAPVETDDTGPAVEKPAMEPTNQTDIPATEDAGELAAVNEPVDSAPASPPALPPIPGFDLTNMSRNQGYAIRTALVLSDCCVQSTAEAVFDVLARNFIDVGGLCWWLQRIGKGPLVPRTKGKDLVDAIRVVAHALHRQLRADIGQRIPRW